MASENAKMAAQDDVRNPVERLAEEFAARLRRGQRLSIAEYVTAYPQHAEEIREVFPTVLAMEKLRWRENSDRRLAQDHPRTRFAGKKVGDFRIVREIGRGGMGVVYEAEQLSLKRRVALKVLARGIAAATKHRQRFQREAESAARLHHTNIVPVFGIGEHDKLVYYVMQYIEGVGLDEIVAELRHAGLDSQTCVAAEAPSDRQEKTTKTSRATTMAIALCDGSFSGRKKGDSSENRVLSSADETIQMPAAAGKPGDTSANCDLHQQRENGKRANGPPPIIRPTERAHAADAGSRHRYFRSVARIGVQLADALHYAHCHGILHRDVKPSNLLLDGEGVVWITDFGLAKPEDSEGVTKTGDIVGTLRYMAPELFHGRTGARSDIYSLGLTLYEMLTLRPAFAETHYGGLIQQKTTTGPPSPRELDSAIPHDLETIVLKACATDPAHRYQTAGELATDLERFLEDRPILARRATPVDRFWRWTRRNPVIAALVSVAVVLLVAVAMVSTIGSYRTKVALDQAKQQHARAEENRKLAVAAADEANGQRERAEANLRMAVRAFEDITNKIAARGLPDAAGVDLEDGRAIYAQSAITAADAELLQTLLGFFDQFAQRNRTDLTLQTATAYRHIGDIRQRLGQFTLAKTAYRQALDIHESLADSRAQNSTHLLVQAEILNELGSMANQRGDMQAAIDAHLDAERILEGVRETSSTSEVKAGLARTYNLLGSVGAPTTQRTLRGMMQTYLPNVASRRDGPRMPGGMMPGLPEVDDYLPKALELLDELSRQCPADAEYRLELAECYRNHVQSAWKQGDSQQADEWLQNAIDILDQLVVDFPDVSRYQYELADTLRLADLASAESSTRYRERIHRAVTICEQLTAAYPNVPHYQALLADSLSERAAILCRAGQTDRAEEDYQRALACQQLLVDQFDTVSTYRLAYVRSLHGLAVLRRQGGRADESQELLETAIEHLEQVAEGASDPRKYQPFYAPLYFSLSQALFDLDEEELAREASGKARSARPSFGPGEHRRLGRLHVPRPGLLPARFPRPAKMTVAPE